MKILEERIAAFENEQLLIKRNLQENLELDKELIQIVKELHRTIEENTIKTKQEKSKRNIDDELVTNRKCLEYQVYTNGSIFRVRKKSRDSNNLECDKWNCQCFIGNSLLYKVKENILQRIVWREKQRCNRSYQCKQRNKSWHKPLNKGLTSIFYVYVARRN